MKDKDRYYLVMRIKEIVKEMNKELMFVVVEGERDREVLRKLGFNKEIYLVKEVKKMKGKYTILTDFDEEGRNQALLLRKKLGDRFLIDVYRKKFFEALKDYGINEIEGIGKSLKIFKKIIQL
ncbi:MAG: hypothetical protein RMJ18_02115 [Candidatus Aenigmarchaeota archaeon]|nr:hypothetical protein [Candidatus Aenigmarchaeota archaeon]MCX8191095.1 hypothetical protein [Candidatus Aenigmarchaeota archaeon]MDW8160191.1 hypothetical protein [Candidatus Aenigmarchaeota archaeon]